MPGSIVAIADTGPLNYLILIDAVDVLPRLFGNVVVPPAVRRELVHPSAPLRVRQWATSLPGWVNVSTDPQQSGQDDARLGAGENAVISSAGNMPGCVVLMDDRAARLKAMRLGFTTIGTLGIIDRAARHDLVDVSDVMDRLRTTNFRCRPEMLDDIVAGHQDRGSV